ncbi:MULTISPECIES: cupin domain-containing protein [unclassified Bradyrhizobium]|uniref:cupin domain-containing protein n=1 Tax=unclassified Bradyrhizobium TaxID=2631580 RepID=UPI0020B186C7|nr:MULTISPECIES: cupin domain-containing protein [unclassified Bradyrhizobium]MCP3382554.1 cupin domain-containing protein [Bradyrhizobium sp. CCGUVB4N]MCP3443638.1 cupin domain-containing protein [Bradyrhizobium sp. CCGUVB14]WFU77824.1 cupin domain-containing protein [Bradyrhizobium sp. CIAT3101]
MTNSFLRTVRVLASAAVLATNLVTLPAAAAQPAGVTRTDLQRHDLSAPGREAVQVRVDLAPGVAFGRHSHPGEEIIYVLAGSIEYDLDGKPPVTLKTGDVLFIPAGTIHAAKNAGDVSASELATYIVEKDKPLLTIAK